MGAQILPPPGKQNTEHLSPPTDVEHAFDTLGNNLLRTLTYTAMQLPPTEPLTAVEQSWRLHDLQDLPHDDPPTVYRLSKTILSACVHILEPGGLIVTSPLPKGTRQARAFSADIRSVDSGRAVAGTIMDWQLRRPERSLLEFIGDSRTTSLRGMPLTCLDIYGALLRRPDQPQSLAEIRTRLGRPDKSSMNRVLQELACRGALIAEQGAYSINPDMEAAIADLVLRMQLLKLPLFAAYARKRAFQIIKRSGDVAFLISKYRLPGIAPKTDHENAQRRYIESSMRPIPVVDEWRSQGLCFGNNSELFFPTGTIGPSQVQTQRAKVVCRSCPVVASCLQWAITAGSQEGVLGGTTPEERREFHTADDDRKIVWLCHQVLQHVNRPGGNQHHNQ